MVRTRLFILAFLVGIFLAAELRAQGEQQVWTPIWFTEDYEDMWPGLDGLPYTDDDMELPERGNGVGSWSMSWIDVNGDGAFDEGEDTPYTLIAGGTAFSTRSYPEYGVIYESEDWNAHHHAFNDGASRNELGDPGVEAEDVEHVDKAGTPDGSLEWEWAQNAYFWNNEEDNQWGLGRKRWSFGDMPDGNPADEPEAFDKWTAFVHGKDDPGTVFDERGECRREFMTSDDGIIQGILIPLDLIPDLQDGDLEPLMFSEVDTAAYVRDVLGPRLDDNTLAVFTDSLGCGAIELPATHLVIFQLVTPITINEYDRCANHDAALAQAAYHGVVPNGEDGDAMKTTDAVYRVSQFGLMNVELGAVDEDELSAARAWADTPEDNVRRIMPAFDNMFRRDDNNVPRQHFGRYEASEGWEFATDFSSDWGCPSDGRADHVLRLFPGNVGGWTLPLGVDMNTSREVNFLAEFGTNTLLEPDVTGDIEDARHQMILLDADDNIVAYAEISDSASQIHIGGTIGANGLAENPTASGDPGDPAFPGDGDVGEYTRLVLQASCAGVQLLHSAPGDYPIFRFNDIEDGGIYNSLATGPGVTGTVRKVRFATTGAGDEEQALAIDTIAVFHDLDAAACGVSLRPGDTNSDGKYDIADPIALLGFLFGGGDIPECYKASPTEFTETGTSVNDFNGDAAVNIADPVAGLGYLFSGTASHVLGTDCVAMGGTCEASCR